MSAITTLLAAIKAHRLVLFTGAGLSIPAPSNLPSARVLAEEAARRHADATTEQLENDLLADIEAQASFFHANGQLETYYLRELIDWDRFCGSPNAGHFAVADLLLSHAIELNVTTNIDVLVERAAEVLGYEDLVGAIEAREAAAYEEHKPFLKIHGCYRHGKTDTLWCREQLGETPWNGRTQDASRWLAGALMQKDLVFIGYWTDWSYLNQVLESILADQVPRSVTIIDPGVSSALAAKAPGLWAWAHRPGIHFQHIQNSGSEFLERLRRLYSLVQLRQIAKMGTAAYRARAGDAPPAFPSIDHLTTDDLYDVRRDWSAVPRTRATVGYRQPHHTDALLGRTFYELIASGGVFDGSFISVRGLRVRLIQGAGSPLYAIREKLSADLTPVDTPDFVACVGAEDDGGAARDVLRPDRESSVIRPGQAGEWGTHHELRSRLGLT
jgi:NAD-dependent SIR2 family protein deacetylase